jgi:hypothetical protein
LGYPSERPPPIFFSPVIPGRYRYHRKERKKEKPRAFFKKNKTPARQTGIPFFETLAKQPKEGGKNK